MSIKPCLGCGKSVLFCQDETYSLAQGERRLKMHDHNTTTCESCKSNDDYCKEQYARYEAEIATLKELGNRLASRLEPYRTRNVEPVLEAWRKAAGK